ncbi:MAG: hypothetical protein M1817_005434 [Caeruleum heppii]|nr:MAG: hypothetical protein M1817_005434 [Caeruleum heppii]
MSSGSLKEVLRSLSATLSGPHPPSALPDDVLDILQLYLDRHHKIDSHESQRLHQELFDLFNKQVAGHESKHAPFLAALRLLSPMFRGVDRLLAWWDVLIRPTIESLGQQKGIVADARGILLNMLIFDEDDDPDGERSKVSAMFTDKLLDVYLQKTKIPTTDGEAAALNDQKSRFIASHLESVLVAFGRRRPKDLMMAINSLIVHKEYRGQAMALLSTFVRHQPPHLYEVLQTPLMDNLLKCLLIDTSTTVMSIALTTIVMFLPHIPSSLAPFLPRLFAVYSRILCWEKYSSGRFDDDGTEGDDDNASGKSESLSNDADSATDLSWDKLQYSFDSADSFTPDLSHFFTFLYGLYPLNLMSFLQKPARYLREASHPIGASLDLDKKMIRQRTEQFRRVHLLHPNLYTTTAETELTDSTRFVDSDPADVVANCMALCATINHSLGDPGPPPSGKLPVIPESQMPTEEIPAQMLLADGNGAAQNGDSSPTDSRPGNSWRNTQSTAVASHMSYNGVEPLRLLRQASYHSLGQPSSRSNGNQSRYNSPNLRPQDRVQDSPTLPAALVHSSSDVKLKDMLQTQESLRGSYHPSQTNDSVHSLGGHEKPSPQLDAYIQSLSHGHHPRSPSARPISSMEATPNLAYLQREVLLLRNDLNFERYLKQQHLSHIGQLQRKYIKEATVEAETQKLINTNKALKVKQEEAKRNLATLRRETTARHNTQKKWESELNNKVRALREEQKQWKAEEDQVRGELHGALQECDHLRRLVIETEARELLSRQRLQSAQNKLEDLETLRLEIERLHERLQQYEGREHDFNLGKQGEEILHKQLEMTRMKLKSRETEREQMKRAYDQRIVELESRLQSVGNANPTNTPQAFQAMLDSALAASHARFAKLQKVYNHLLNRYAELEMKYLDLQASQESRETFGDRNGNGHARLMSHGIDSMDFYGNGEPGSEYSRQHESSDPSSPRDDSGGFLGMSSSNTSRSPTYGRQPKQLESLQPHRSGSISASSAFDRITPFDSSLMPFRPQHSTSGEAQSRDESVHSSEHSGQSANTRAKIKANSEVRVYGRGGVQNIGKKEKEKKEKKEKERKEEKEKKSLRAGSALKGIRGLV